MKQILITQPNTIAEEQKKVLYDEGFVIIETENPDSIRVINQFDGISNDSVVDAAFKAINQTAQNSNVRNYFVDMVLKSILKK